MTLDPRRNLAAIAAGILGVGLFVAIEVMEPTQPLNPLRLVLLASGVANLLGGMWPSRRVRFVLLLVAVPALVVVGILALWTVGFAILLVALVALVGLIVEYAREGREQSIGLPLPGRQGGHR